MSLPVGRSSSPAVRTAPVVPTASPLISSRPTTMYVPGRERHLRGVRARARGLQRHFAREALGPSHVDHEAAERLRAPVVADHARAHVELASGGVGLEAHPRVLALARHVARGLGDHPRCARPRRPAPAPAVLEVAGERRGAADARRPHRQHRIAVGAREQHARSRLGDGHHVALEGRRLGEIDPRGDRRRRAVRDAEVLLDDRGSRGEDRLLREDGGQGCASSIK